MFPFVARNRGANQCRDAHQEADYLLITWLTTVSRRPLFDAHRSTKVRTVRQKVRL